MDLNFTEKILLIARRKRITLENLADRMGFSRQNFYKRCQRETWSETEMRTLADAVGCSLELVIIDKETAERY